VKSVGLTLKMSLVLFLGIVALAWARQWRAASIWNDYPVNPDNVFVGLYILWLLVETPVAGRDADAEGKKTSDSATCLVYGTAQALTFLSALWFPSAWQAPGIVHFFGMGLFVAGVCCRLWAIRTLGKFYSHLVRTTARHTIVDSGPYRFVRHPAYAGMIIANTGICITFLNAVTSCIFLFALVPAILLRIRIEERVLFAIEGYSDFAENRKRLFPGIW